MSYRDYFKRIPVIVGFLSLVLFSVSLASVNFTSMDGFASNCRPDENSIGHFSYFSTPLYDSFENFGWISSATRTVFDGRHTASTQSAHALVGGRCDVFESKTSASVSENSDVVKEQPPEKFDSIAVWSYDDLRKKYKGVRVISKTFYVIVYEVENLVDHQHYAMRIKFSPLHSPHEYEKDFFNRMLEVQKYNPFQAKVYGKLWLENRDYDISSRPTGDKYDPFGFKEDPPAGEFMHHKSLPSDRKVLSYYHDVTIMELGLGDLEDKKAPIKPNSLPVELQCIFNKYNLVKFNIADSDDKDRNYIYKIVDDLYEGQRLSDYDYWHFVMGEYDIYLPRQPYIVKRIDFEAWHFPGDKQEHETIDEVLSKLAKDRLSSLAKRNGISLEGLLDSFKKPSDPKARILDLSK